MSSDSTNTGFFTVLPDACLFIAINFKMIIFEALNYICMMFCK